MVLTRQMDQQKLKADGAKQKFYAESEIIDYSKFGPRVDFYATQDFR
jgi:hypothetical protein